MTPALIPDMSALQSEPLALIDQLSPQARAGIEGIVSSLLKEDSTARRAEVRTAWRQRLFKNGIQHLSYSEKDYTWSAPGSDDAQLPRYMDVYNIYAPHNRSFVSILSQNPPGVNFPPDDLQSSVDVTAASYAEKERHVVDRTVHMKTRQMEIADNFCTDGRTMTWTRLDNRGKLRITVHGVLESKVPLTSDMEEWGYAILSRERDIHGAKDEYPTFASKISATDAGEQNYERFARLNVLSGRNRDSMLKNQATEHTAWVRPMRYRKAADPVRDELRKLFPNGFQATVIGGVLVDIAAQDLAEALAVEWPVPGQGQVRVSMLHDVIPAQGSFNDMVNMQRTQAEFGIPGGWLHGGAIDSEATPEQQSTPGVWRTMTPPNGMTVQECMAQEQPSALPAEVGNLTVMLREFSDYTSGDSQSLRGEIDQASGGVYSTEKLITDKAKGQLSPAWAALQWLMAKTYALAVPLSASTAQGERAVPGQLGQERYDPRMILDGRFGCVPDTDSSFPEAMADKRASLQMVLTQLNDPEIVKQPDNLKLIKQYSGLTDLVIPGAEARDKQLREIEQLLQETPIPNDPATADPNAPPPPPFLPSVQVDNEWDMHQPELDKIVEWLSSSARYEQERKSNVAGIENVKLHGAQHRAAIAAANQPQLPKPINVSVSMPITDPATQAKILQMNGIDADPETLTASQVPGLQEAAARTQHQAAGAMHQSVLAAKEEVAPVLPATPANVPPDEAGKESK